MSIVELVAVKELELFDFRWPEGIESFEGGWSFGIRAGAARHFSAPVWPNETS